MGVVLKAHPLQRCLKLGERRRLNAVAARRQQPGRQELQTSHRPLEIRRRQVPEVRQPALTEGPQVVDAEGLLKRRPPGSPLVHQDQKTLKGRQIPAALTKDEEVNHGPCLGVLQCAPTLVDVVLPILLVELEQPVKRNQRVAPSRFGQQCRPAGLDLTQNNPAFKHHRRLEHFRKPFIDPGRHVGKVKPLELVKPLVPEHPHQRLFRLGPLPRCQRDLGPVPERHSAGPGRVGLEPEAERAQIRLAAPEQPDPRPPALAPLLQPAEKPRVLLADQIHVSGQPPRHRHIQIAAHRVVPRLHGQGAPLPGLRGPRVLVRAHLSGCDLTKAVMIACGHPETYPQERQQRAATHGLPSNLTPSLPWRPFSLSPPSS